MSKKDFDKLLFEAIDEGLSSIGESSKQAIYLHLEKDFEIKKHEIPYKIEDFVRALEKIFGLGAGFLEILIMKNLYEKVGRTVHLHEPKNFAFTKYVAATERSFIEKSKAEELIQCDQMVS
jgi:hypothetical protein